MVRHGHAAAGFDADLDPGLDDAGREEAERMAEQVAPLGPLPIVVSPLRRCRETAAPLEARWGIEASVDPRVGEIESPGLADRGPWLRELMQGEWTGQPAELVRWRSRVVDALLEIDTDTVVVSHFVAINVAVGHATDDARVRCCSPNNCSVTELRNDGGRLEVLQLGGQGVTQVR